MNVVIYHGNCPDGFTAAWAAWRKLGADARYVPALYGDPLPDVAAGDTVFVLDFSYPRPLMERLAEIVVGRLRVLDHHKTAQADLAGLPYATFDMEHSGAVLAWRHFHPDADVPRLVRYVEDRDLWRFKLPYSHEISAWLLSFPFVFGDWSQLNDTLEFGADGVNLAYDEGRAILRAKQQAVEMMAKQCRWADVGGHFVPVVNASSHFSDVGNELCKAYPDAPFAAYYFDRADGKRQWGLRSVGDFDVSEVAKQYGGGGHKNAAGFQTELVIG